MYVSPSRTRQDSNLPLHASEACALSI